MTATPDPPARRPRRPKALIPLLLLLPTLVIFLVITGYPVVQLFVSSFHTFGRRQIFGAPPDFVGLANYQRVLSDPYFWEVM